MKSTSVSTTLRSCTRQDSNLQNSHGSHPTQRLDELGRASTSRSPASLDHYEYDQSGRVTTVRAALMV